jgi:hypothetical protein
LISPARDADMPLLRLGDRAFPHDPRPALVARLGEPPVVSATQLAAVPVMLSPVYSARLDALTGLLDTALRGIVAHYFDDPRIRAIYALPEAMERLLQLAEGRPYRIGCTRPDFIYDPDGQPRLCEIGARYPLNGWMLSACAAEVYASSTPRPFLDDLCAGYRPGETVAMVHAREAGTEIFLLGEALRERGIGFVQTHPSALGVENGRLHAGGEWIDHVILEMDRTEIPLIPPDVLQQLIDTGAYFNDIRTLILVHDKRTLAVLWDEAIMADILPPGDAAALRALLIPSWTIAGPEACEALLAQGGDMIAKRSSGGRGIDALVRSDCGEGAWRMRVCAEWGEDMYQLYLPQLGFRAPGEANPIHLVGMLLCRDGTSYGAGVFRGSDAKIINVHGARGHVYVPLAAS